MDGRGGCCIARYGGGGGHYDLSKVETIMLRFRPIAPKPTTTAAGGASGGSGGSSEMSEVTSCRYDGRGRKRRNRSSSSNNKKNNRSRIRCNRRKCNKNNNNNNNNNKTFHDHGEVVTLPLLPETPTPVESKSHFPKWLSFGSYNVNTENYNHYSFDGVLSADPTVVTAPPFQIITKGAVTVTSYVTVECVTDAFVDVDALGGTDKEKKSRLERDPCPSFLSDPSGRVVWTNQAYREMVGLTDHDDDHVIVWLVMKDAAKVPVMVGFGACGPRAFTCRVRVQYSHQDRCMVGIGLGENNQVRGSNLMVPCDVWRMDGGGFAWILDIKTALCLGR